jgi:small subunit ribosomal protein S8
MIVDPISDMFTRIRNAVRKSHEKVDMPSSKVKIEIAKILKKDGFIVSYKNLEDHKQGVLRIYLKYMVAGKSVLKGIKRVSKSSLRIYKGYRHMPRNIGGLGITIISTSKGIITDKQAKVEKIGGEIIGYVW